MGLGNRDVDAEGIGTWGCVGTGLGPGNRTATTISNNFLHSLTMEPNEFRPFKAIDGN